MANNENSILFSLAHLHRLATSSAAGGGAALAVTRPISSAPFVPLNVMPPMVLPARRHWNSSWLVPTVLGLGGLLVLGLTLLVVVLARSPQQPDAAPAAAPQVVTAPSLLPPPPAPAAATVPAAVENTAAERSSEAQPAPAPQPTAQKARSAVKVGKARGKAGRQRFAKSRTRPKATAALARRPTTKKATGRRSELDALIDAALR